MIDIIKQLEAEPSKNAKIDILKENINNRILRQFFLMALNPHMKFGIRQIPDYTYVNTELNLSEAMQLLYRLKPGDLTGHAGIDHLVSILTRVHPKDADLIERIIQKEVACGVSYKTINKIWKKLIPTTPYMRCKSAVTKHYEKIEYPAIVQKKANGLFLNNIFREGTVKVESRNGKELTMLGVFDDLATAHNLVIHGEGLVLKEGRKIDDEGAFLDRQTGNGIINKAIQDTISIEEANRIIVECWDLVPYEDWVAGKCDIPYDERFHALKELIKHSDQNKLIVIETKEVNDFAEAAKYYNELLVRGEEGAVLKNYSGLWKDHTSPNQVKMKVKDPADLKCVGTYRHSQDTVTRGKKVIDSTNWIGGLNLESADGVIKVNTGSGLTDEDRQREPSYYIGKIIELEYNEITLDKSTGQMSLFLPIYVTVRDDKDEADDYQTILERSTFHGKYS